jgi:hypothetical protein
MAIKLIANYSKRLGLPGYSSHQFEVSVETEIGNTSELDFAAERLYSSLQSAVDLFLMLPMAREVHPVRRFLCLRLRIPRHLTPENRHGIVRKSRGKSFYRWHVKTGSTIPHFMIWPYSVSAKAFPN